MISSAFHDDYNRLQDAMRLDLSKPIFIGRSEELHSIQKSFSEKKTLFLISGASGVGKSLLAERAVARIEDDKLVGKGKFEQYGTRNTPFYAIVGAIDSVLEQCITNHTSTGNFSEISSSISRALRDEAGRLIPLLPHLGYFLKAEENESLDFSADSAGVQNASTYDRLKHLFHTLLETLSIHVRLVLHIDDLQWIDSGSLDLLEHLTVRKTIQNLFVIGSYRDDEVTGRLRSYLRECENRAVDFIHLRNMTEEGTNELLSKNLELRLEETNDLAELVYEKTAGNAFFVTQFLQALQDKELLKYSLSTYKWAWDLEEVRATTSISDNIVDLVQDRVNHLREQDRLTVQLAACLGSHFQTDTLEGVVNYVISENQSDARFDVLKGLDVSAVLDLLAKFGLIEATIEGWHKFVHDRIQQASYLLFDEGPVRDRLHLQIGVYLRQKLESSDEDEDWLLFGAVDQLNKASEILTNEAIRTDLACLNYKAAKKAFSMSAFLPASEYSLQGSQVLDGPGKWTNHYDLALSICTLAAQACRAVGNHNRSHGMIQEVIANAFVHSDSLQVRFVEVEMLGHSGELSEAISKGKDMVRQQGYHIPQKPNFLQVVRAVLTIRSMVLKMSDAEILALPRCQEKDVIDVTRAIDSIGSFSYLLDLKNDCAIAGALSVKIMLQKGVTPFSPIALVMLGVIMLAMGKIDDSCRLGSLALRLSEQHEFRETYGAVIFVAHFFNIHFKKPIQTCLERYLLGYRTGMRVGDTYYASFCNQGYCMFSYYSGLPLECLKEDWTKFLSEMVEYGQNTVRFLHVPLLQKVVNLVNESSEDVLDFTSGVMQDKDFTAQAKADTNLGALEFLYQSKAELAFMWCDFDAAGDYLGEYDALNSSSDDMPSFTFVRETFFRGLINIALARLYGGRKYRRQYNKQIRLLRKWVRAGNMNCVDVLALLLAEERSLGSRGSSLVLPLYDKAILSAAKTSFAQVEALACECAGRYLICIGESDKATSYFQRSQECYSRWGAKAKVLQLERTCDFECHDAGEGPTAFFGKPRFDGRPSMVHKKLEVTRRKSDRRIANSL